MTKGDAFNRGEVTSSYVTPDDRYVVSFIVGLSAEDVRSPQEAALAAVGILRGGGFKAAVHDRETGLTEEVDIPSEQGGAGA